MVFGCRVRDHWDFFFCDGRWGVFMRDIESQLTLNDHDVQFRNFQDRLDVQYDWDVVSPIENALLTELGAWELGMGD